MKYGVLLNGDNYIAMLGEIYSTDNRLLHKAGTISVLNWGECTSAAPFQYCMGLFNSLAWNTWGLFGPQFLPESSGGVVMLNVVWVMLVLKIQVEVDGEHVGNWEVGWVGWKVWASGSSFGDWYQTAYFDHWDQPTPMGDNNGCNIRTSCEYLVELGGEPLKSCSIYSVN